MSRVALNARMAPNTDKVEVALLMIEHEALATPVRLSTDPTERLSTDPLMYGTRSSWMGADPLSEPFLFVLASAEIPGDQEDAPAAATLVLENVDNDIAALLRSVTSRATVHMAVVFSDSPDLIEAEFRDMRLIAAEGDASEISLSISREPIEDESCPSDRMTRDRFPGLFL
ncbi:hypothetical protein [Antarcticimicrobium sediminis]|uniref:DUF1833 domain-containing protein n=1 Tax=Antarcticimicrobium sediminis TaxID=2546227 RepID=A0A4R5F0X4_9RHOB|nr:hypothetical protein [Antarcticimicrobium sediminis]TDE40922.1 hypothetical protein E1B25_01535 [Antarcticimicrobium sediminis]